MTLGGKARVQTLPPPLNPVHTWDLPVASQKGRRSPSGLRAKAFIQLREVTGRPRAIAFYSMGRPPADTPAGILGTIDEPFDAHPSAQTLHFGGLEAKAIGRTRPSVPWWEFAAAARRPKGSRCCGPQRDPPPLVAVASNWLWGTQQTGTLPPSQQSSAS